MLPLPEKIRRLRWSKAESRFAPSVQWDLWALLVRWGQLLQPAP